MVGEQLVLTLWCVQALAPYTTQCIGIDLSENMVDAYNARARNQVGSCFGPFCSLALGRSPSSRRLHYSC